MSPLQLRAIRPRRNPGDKARSALKGVERAIDDEFKPYMLDDLGELVADWEHKPGFRMSKSITPRAITFTVVPKKDKAGKIFTYVDQGTRPHVIRPRRAKVLAFKGAAGPKTRPVGGQRRRKVPPGKQVFARLVRHPGTQPRKFFERRKARYQRKFQDVVERAFRRAARA